GREWGDNDANRSVRKALNKDLEKLTKLYAKRATRVYAEIDSGIDRTAMWLSLLAAFAVMLATVGALVIARSVAQPIADITRITEAVAAGDASITVPYSDHSDEIGALARSVGVFQRAMRTNEELNRTVRSDARGARTHFRSNAGGFDQSRRHRRPGFVQDGKRDGGLVGGILECARHCIGRRRTVCIRERNRPPSGAVQRDRNQGSERGRPYQSRGQGTGRSGQPHRRCDQAYHRYRRTDQSACAQRHHRGRARRRGRTRFRGGRRGGKGAGRPDQPR